MRIKNILLTLSLLSFYSAAALGSDPGQPDSVYFCDSVLYYAQSQGDSTPSAFIRVAFYNDSNVHAITIPLAYVLAFATLDSVSYVGSRVEYLQFKTVNDDTLNGKLLLGAVQVEEDPIPPGRGLFATFWFTLNNSSASVSLDTTEFEPNNHLYFVNSSSQLYTPVWAGAKEFDAVTFLAGDVNNDHIITLVDVIYLVNYVLKGGPPPPVLAAGDADAGCDINLVDVIYLVNYILKNGPAPLAGCIFTVCN